MLSELISMSCKELVSAMRKCANDEMACTDSNHCPCYDGSLKYCPDILMNKAADMLEKHECRLVTLEELQDINMYRALWLEERYDIHGMMCMRYRIGDVLYIALPTTGAPYKLSDLKLENYGKHWRCWTCKPTTKEREEIPWTD